MKENKPAITYERLVEAYYRMEAFEWDEIFGPEPEEFASLEDFEKRDFLSPITSVIANIVPEECFAQYRQTHSVISEEERTLRLYPPERILEFSGFPYKTLDPSGAETTNEGKKCADKKHKNLPDLLLFFGFCSFLLLFGALIASLF